MSRKLLFAAVIGAGMTLGSALVPTSLAAQDLAVSSGAPSLAADTTVAQVSNRATPVAAGVTRPSPVASADAVTLAAPNVGLGKNLALIGVGAAAIVLGAAVGDTPGTLMIVGGAAVGLYGLYHLLK